MRTSWIDALTKGVDGMPAPRWAVYLAVSILIALAQHVAFWADGLVPFPDIEPSLVFGSALPAVILWSMQALNGVAVRALQNLRPALELSRGDQDALAADLQRTPATSSMLLVPVGVVVGTASVLSSPESWGLGEIGALSWSASLAISIWTVVVALVFLDHVIHQLRVVDQVHRHSVRVDLFHLEPLYAFSTLTSRTGMVLLAIEVLAIGGLTLTSGGIVGFSSGGVVGFSSGDVVVTLVMFGVAVSCFVVPLLSLHERISEEKDRRLGQANGALAQALGEVHRRIAEGDMDGAAKLNDAVAAASAGLLAVSRVSTWPWRPETLRGFVSAVLLPIALWLVFELLRRVLPG